MERKKTSLIILGVCALVLSVVGVTYAFWTLNLKQTGEDKIASSCFEVSLINEGTAIHLEKAFPIVDSDGEALDPYTFTITNTCNTYAGYQINLESLGKSTDVDTRLKPEYLKVKINEKDNEGIISKLGSNETVKTTLSDAYESHKLMTGYLGPNESKNFEFRLWLDGDLTMENTDAMNKTYASKITVTASYLAEENVPPTVDLELAVCENTITAKGTGTPYGEKSITKYEFKLDNAGDWTDVVEQTKEFTVEEPGSHTVSLRVTDNKGITSETSKTIEIGDPETVRIYGKDIPITTCKNGLYEVKHDDLVAEDGGIPAEELDNWKKTEYRFAGVDYNKDSPETPYVHNYVWFNSDDGCTSEEDSDRHCELWRIIGLVNVKTTSNTIEQRLKIIRANSLGDYGWDYKTNRKGSSTSNYGSNDWTDSQLMEMLNDGYYNSSSNVSCYKGSSGFSSSQTTCQFDGTDPKTKGLEESARNMIDKEIIWNLGGSSSYYDVTVSQFYKIERGTSVYTSSLPFARETEWKASNTGRASLETTAQKHSDESLFRSIALPYPSDYGYATNGGTLGREECFKKELYHWNSEEYQTQCAQTDWLKPESGYMWTLSSSFLASYSVFRVYSVGSVDDMGVISSSGVLPALYLSSKVKIVDNENDGSYDRPYELQLGP